MENIKKCIYCGADFKKKINVSASKWTKSKFCSLKCRYAVLNLEPFSDDRKLKQAELIRGYILNETTDQRKKRMLNVVRSRKINGIWKHARLGKTGDSDPNWKGEDATYNSKHKWIRKHWIKTGHCEECGKNTAPYKSGRAATEWHNINKEYKRDRNCWKELCVSCHRKIHLKLIKHPTRERLFSE